jgi:hypothetical protein
MTRSSLAGLGLAVLLLAGCSAPAAAPESSAPVTDSGSGTDSGTDAAPLPGPEICDMQTEWDRVDGALTAGKYADAAMFVSAVFPVESLKPEFLELRELIPAYAEVVDSGDSAAIEAAADDLAAIELIQARLQGFFAQFCG